MARRIILPSPRQVAQVMKMEQRKVREHKEYFISLIVNVKRTFFFRGLYKYHGRS